MAAPMRETDFTLRICDADGGGIISYSPKPRARGTVPPPATEPSLPADIASADELYLTGLHLEQYRHATRCPAAYWREALRRDPGDARCNNALGLWRLRRGEFSQAETHFRKAIERLTRRNANPYDGEPFYNLGLCLRYQADQSSPPSPDLLESAYAAFYKAAWNEAWQSAAYHAVAELDCRQGAWAKALEHLDRSLRFNTDNTRARDLKALVMRRLGRHKEAEALLCETLSLDPLDWWARHLSGELVQSDLQVGLDLAHDYARAGLCAEAIGLLEKAIASPRDLPDQSWGAKPLVHYTLGWLHEKTGDLKAAQASFRCATLEAPEYCFPARLEEIAILEDAIHAMPALPIIWATCCTTAAGMRKPSGFGNTAPGLIQASRWSGGTLGLATSTFAGGLPRRRPRMKGPFVPTPPQPGCSSSATSSGSGSALLPPNVCASSRSTRLWCASVMT
jgi:tetratricopeptide (TPR) repeat protein